MSQEQHLKMHQEHLSWDRDVDLWRDDLRTWQKEFTKVLAELKFVEKTLKEHENSLREHASAIRLHIEESDEHEHAIADYEKGGEGVDLARLAKRHKLEAVRHADQRANHEKLKRHHHTLLAQWSLLVKAIRNR